ncbi:hypothetical protein Pyn_28145 [Prunus yedoensis var. nudiflora]|uniref:Uncharacterized protein n=1 Tax=Prunus yedoensis var. nudiflora TaxID=2094558 RepID=A0A314Z5N7_PRUYE|nr:hypothetical protein Pyn_28145 [Prunus yedoensis var. nudiflora]
MGGGNGGGFAGSAVGDAYLPLVHVAIFEARIDALLREGIESGGLDWMGEGAEIGTVEEGEGGLDGGHVFGGLNGERRSWFLGFIQGWEGILMTGVLGEGRGHVVGRAKPQGVWVSAGDDDVAL